MLNAWHHVRGKIALRVTVSYEGGVAGEGRVVDVPKLHSWGKRTMPLTNINSDWMSNASSGLCINLFIYLFVCLFVYVFVCLFVYLFIYLYHVGPLFRILGCNNRIDQSMYYISLK